MSNIQTNINLLHYASGMNVSGGARRVAHETSFSGGSLALATPSESIPTGDIITPRTVALKNYAGDDALVSIDGGVTFPFRLRSADTDVTLITFDFESHREISTFVCQADTAGSLRGDHVNIYDHNGLVWPWFSIPSKATGSITYGTPAVATKATGVLTLTANAANNETVAVGATTYTFKTALSAGPTVANEVRIGAAATNSIDNLIAAITAGAGIGVEYSTGTVANASATATAGAGDTMNVEALTAGYAGSSIATTETLANGSFAAATLTGGLNSTSVVVNGTTFTYVASAPAANQFSNIAELEALVEAVALITSTQNGTVVSIIADTAGTAGNAITLALGANITGTTAVSGATLTGGTDSSTPPVVTTERLITVTIAEGATATQVAVALAAALDADAEFIAPVPTTTSVVVTDQHAGARADATAGDTGWASVTAGGQGSAYFDVKVKSVGVSELAYGVAPN